jgi:outer membrane protein
MKMTALTVSAVISLQIKKEVVVKGLKIISITLICVFSLVISAQAQGTAKKIAFLNLSKLFDNYEKTKEFDTELQAKYTTYEKARDEKIEKIKEAQGKLALLKEEEKAKMTQDVEKMRTELLEFDQTQTTDMKRQRDEKIREVLLEIEKTVSDFAKKDNYDLILNDRVLIYGNQTMDITDQILKIMNEVYNKK